MGIRLTGPCPSDFHKSVLFPWRLPPYGRGSGEGWVWGNVRHSLLLSVLWGCKHLLGTRAALLSTRKLQVSTGCMRQAMREMSQVFSLKCHLLFRNTISCKARLTVECWKVQGALAAGVTFVSKDPFTLSSLLSNKEVSSKLAFNCTGEMAECLIPHIKISVVQWAWFVIYQFLRRWHNCVDFPCNFN